MSLKDTLRTMAKVGKHEEEYLFDPHGHLKLHHLICASCRHPCPEGEQGLSALLNQIEVESHFQTSPTYLTVVTAVALLRLGLNCEEAGSHP